MTRNQFVLIGIVAALATVFHPAYGAIKKGESSNPTASFNPKAAPDDIILPMPGGQAMVFKLVAIPAKNRLFDKKFSMGVIRPDEDRGIFDRRIDGYVSGPFVLEDFPKNWKKVLKGKENGYAYYLIGKYEITNAQWQSIMGGDAGGQKPDLPKTQISWYQIQDFLQKYNTWLMNNHSEKLPVVEGTPAFVRLPTEEEWEFAARGGNLAPELLEFSDFPLEKGKNVDDYAIFGSNYDSPKPIGTKLPNPLGLYDMGGNVAEMVQSPFQLTVSDNSGQNARRRLHGSTGGLISKGGSFLSSSEIEVYPGRRNELKMFVKNDKNEFEPFHARSVGCRLVLSSLNVQGNQHLQNLVNEDKKLYGGALTSTDKKTEQPVPAESRGKELVKASTNGTSEAILSAKGKDALVTIDKDSTPLQALDQIIEAAGSPFMQSNLYQLKDIIKDSNSALERERDSNLTNSIRSAIYKIDSLRSLAFRCWYLTKQLKDFEKRFPPSTLEGKYKQQFNQIKNTLRDYVLLLDTATNFYKSSLMDLNEQPALAIETKIGQMRDEYRGHDLLNEHMQQNITYLESNIGFIRKRGLENLKNIDIWKKVIPGNILNLILPELEQGRKY